MSSVVIIKDSFDELPKALAFIAASHRKVCIVTDENVSKLYAEPVISSVEALENHTFIYEIKPGESSKNLETVHCIYDFLIENRFNRDDYVIALGGGVVGDVAGFAASTFKRGLHFIQVPTTLLAMIDSSIGGKTGVNYHGLKNVIGSFCFPKLIYINKNVLSSLPEVERANGMAELIKTGILSSDGFNPEIEKCIDFKKMITAEDPDDEHKRHILNFGHTIGHALEEYYGYAQKHGQCVALGMICALDISASRGWISSGLVDELRDVLAQNGLKTCIRIPDPLKISELCHSDKKIQNNRIQFILLKGMGNPVIVEDVTDEEILKSLEAINE